MIYEIMDDALIPHIRQIAKQAYGKDPWTQQQYEDDMSNSATSYIGAFDTGYLIGYIHYSIVGSQGEVLNIAVHPAYQNQGVAKKLIQAAFKQHLQIISWLLEVRVSNEVAQRVYQAIGFKQISMRRNYYKRPTEDAIVMQYKASEVKA